MERAGKEGSDRNPEEARPETKRRGLRRDIPGKAGGEAGRPEGREMLESRAGRELGKSRKENEWRGGVIKRRLEGPGQKLQGSVVEQASSRMD